MNVLEKILEEMNKIKDGNRKEKLLQNIRQKIKDKKFLIFIHKDMKMGQIISTMRLFRWFVRAGVTMMN